MSLSTAQKRGIGFLILMSFLNISVNAIARHVGVTIHPVQIVFFNNLVAFVVLLPLFLRSTIRLPNRQTAPHYMGRSVLEMIGFSLLFASVQHVPFPAVSVLMLLGPLVGVVVAVLFFGERATRHTWIAMIIGLFGVVLIARPGTDDFTLWSLGVLGAMACFATCMNIIRRLNMLGATIVEIVFYMVVFTGLLAGVASVLVWTTPTATLLYWLLFSGLLSAAAQACASLALKYADVVTVSPFMFLHILWGSLYGALFFNEQITLNMLFGGGIILCGLLVATWHARASHQQR